MFLDVSDADGVELHGLAARGADAFLQRWRDVGAGWKLGQWFRFQVLATP